MLSEQMTKLGTAIAANVHTGVAGERPKERQFTKAKI